MAWRRIRADQRINYGAKCRTNVRVPQGDELRRSAAIASHAHHHQSCSSQHIEHDWTPLNMTGHRALQACSFPPIVFNISD